MKFTSIVGIALSALIAGCATAPPPMPIPQQITDLEQSGVLLTEMVRPQYPYGRGIYVGNGLVISASHVVQDIQPGTWLKLNIWTSDGGGRLLWRSQKWARGRDDLALIRVGDALLNHAMQGEFMSPGPMLTATPVCDAMPTETRDVFVVGWQYILATKLEVNKSNGQFNLSNQVEHGISGSGVVDAEKHCLLGVVSSQNSHPAILSAYEEGSYTGGPQHTLITPIDKTVFEKMLEEARDLNADD